MIDIPAEVESPVASAPLPARLRIRSNDGSELFLVDGSLHLAANGVGQLEARVPPGAYKIRAICAGVQREELILVEPGAELDIAFRVEGVETTGPSASVLGAGADAFGEAVEALNRGSIGDERGMQAVFFFASAAPDTGGSLFRGMRVFPWRQSKEAISLSTKENRIVTAGTRRWEIARLNLVAGLHVLDLPVGERRMRIVLPVEVGAETHVSLRQRDRDHPAGRVGAGQDIAIQMRRESGLMLSDSDGAYQLKRFVRMSDTLELEQSARVALADGRLVTLADQHIDRLLHLKFGDPVIGLIAAHLMFNAIDLRAERTRRERALGTLDGVAFSDDLVKTTLRNLSSLMGQYDADSPMPPENPDLASLLLRAGRSWTKPFVLIVPPLLWRSWATLLDPANAALVSIEPRLWSETKFHQACGPYFSWDPQRMSAERFINRYALDIAEVDAMTARITEIAGNSAFESVPRAASEAVADAVTSVAGQFPRLIEGAASQTLSLGGEPDGGTYGRDVQRRTARHLGVPSSVFDKLL